MKQSLEKQLLSKEINYYSEPNLTPLDEHLKDIRNSLPASQYRSYLVENKVEETKE